MAERPPCARVTTTLGTNKNKRRTSFALYDYVSNQYTRDLCRTRVFRVRFVYPKTFDDDRHKTYFFGGVVTRPFRLRFRPPAGALRECHIRVPNEIAGAVVPLALLKTTGTKRSTRGLAAIGLGCLYVCINIHVYGPGVSQGYPSVERRNYQHFYFLPSNSRLRLTCQCNGDKYTYAV